MLVSKSQAAEHLGVSLSTITRLIDSGQLASIRIGRRRLIDVNAIAAYIATVNSAP